MTSPPPLDLKNVQGDILSGLPKKTETYWFLRIADDHVNDFRTQLGQLLPLISSTADTKDDRQKIAYHKQHSSENDDKLLKLGGVNIAFSKKGLKQLGIGDSNDPIGDALFENGMLNDTGLNDDTSKWLPEFKQDIHVLIFITGDSSATVNSKISEIKKILGATIKEIKRIDGHVRPGKEDGHEHFGYLDGVSQPAVFDIDTTALPGQETVHQGVILLGREGDSDATGVPNKRPTWALDGSFLAFRYLSQLVPEFQDFVDKNNPAGAPKDFLGSRLVGRWKSGAPIDVTPLRDDSNLGKDTSKNDDFRYDPFSQDRCPFAAHTRKTNPRSDLPSTEKQRILRRGIPFGPEVSDEEKQTKTTAHDRGLLFKAYQSSLSNGFQFIQKNWANNPTFPFLFKFGTPKPGFDATNGPGFDPIIGQAGNSGPRKVDIKGGNDPAGKLDLPVEWVVSRGGEYFFSPSIPALKNKFALQKRVGNGEL